MSKLTEITLRSLGLSFDENQANQDGWLTINAPHRGDKNPSFAINIQHGGWIDYGTGEPGNIYGLVRLVHPTMSFTEVKAFVDGKGATKKPQLKKPKYHGNLFRPFWTKGRLSKREKKSFFSHINLTNPPMCNRIIYRWDTFNTGSATTDKQKREN